MVSLKPTSIITAVLMKTLIVLTFSDHVFSEETKKDRCIMYINELYKTPHHSEMFRIGFYQFNEKKIQQINARIVSEKKDDDRWILEKMNDYTFKYFLEVLKTVKIIGKNEMSTQEVHCEKLYGRENQELIQIAFKELQEIKNLQLYQQKYDEIVALKQRRDQKVNKCTTLLTLKYGLNSNISGDKIFDTFYTHWTEADVVAISKPGPIDGFEHVYDDIFQAIPSFYEIYDNALNLADVSEMITPSDYCGNVTNESTSATEELKPADETEKQEPTADETEYD